MTRNVLMGLGVFGLTMAAAIPATAGGVWTGTVAVTSDYDFRGISQTDKDPAIQGSLEYGHSGFFVGGWASSIDFQFDPGADLEIDLYAGYTHAFNKDTSLTGKAVYYWYPGADTSDADYWELIAALDHNFGVFSGNLQVAYTPDFFGSTDSGFWLGGGLELPINDWLTVSANAGQQWYSDNAAVDVRDYFYANVGATVAWEAFTLDLRYVGTDLDPGECFTSTTDGTVCDSRFIATLTFTTGSD